MWKYIVGFILVLTVVWLLFRDTDKYYVVGITDGDTIKVLKNNKEIKVRLAHIDAPETKQPWGTKAKTHLSNKIFNKWVTLEISSIDRYQRSIAIIYYKGNNINLEMVKEGYAWHYKHFSKNTQYEQAQQKAKAAKLGLWSDKNPIEPWNFRAK